MTSASTSITMRLTLLIFSSVSFLCEANRGFAGAASTASWKASQTSVRSPDEREDLEVPAPDEAGDADVASFIFSGSELHRSPSSGITVETQVTTGSGVAPGTVRPKSEAAPLLPDEEQPLWEANFASGVAESKKAIEAQDDKVGPWVSDSGSTVPARMLQAEVLMQAAEEAPAESWKPRMADRALRIYYHAKWLAERNYARAAEDRYREAARLARLSRRSVLASHSLARLGYFLMHWKRTAEATQVLQESMKLNTKSNPLAPYLHGVLERKAAAGDVNRLRQAEEAILKSGEQPSEELEMERFHLIDEINYWREAEGGAKQCLASSDTAYVLICLFGHAVSFVKGFLA